MHSPCKYHAVTNTHSLIIDAFYKKTRSSSLFLCRYTVKADMWAAGCCLYEVCALTPAFTAKSIEHLMVKIRKGAVPVDRLPQRYVMRHLVWPSSHAYL